MQDVVDGLHGVIGPQPDRGLPRQPAIIRSASVRFRHVPGYRATLPCGAEAASAISRRLQKHSYVRSARLANAAWYAVSRPDCT